MTDQQSNVDPRDEPGADLEYDLAHEALLRTILGRLTLMMGLVDPTLVPR